MVGFENLSVDSQKIKANANLFQNKNLKGIKKEKKRSEEELERMGREDILKLL
jgi:hypothetical protein